MAKYTIDELLKASEARSRRDKALISECIDGLGLYAAQKARDNRNSSEPDKVRKLVDALVCYWGLNEGENAKTLEDFLWDFDVRVDNAKCGQEVTGDINKSCVSVIYGLHRYGMEMVTAQGDSAMKDILNAGDLITDVAGYWDFEPYLVAEDMTAKLYAEVRVMLENIPLPGQPVNGRMNVNYDIIQATLFDNDRGFALAYNPKDPASFVTWQFTNDDGNFSFYWGHYMVSEEKARLDYMSRVTDYTRNYALTEKPIPTVAVEMDAEQNYNMIDGVRNNEGTPAPDLTDGQTYEEIRELAPEMLADETADDDRRIPVQILTESQPLVTVTFSEDEQLRNIIKLPLYLANTLFFEADEKQSAKYFAVLHSPEPIAPYLKTDFRIDYTINGKPESYLGSYDIGIGDGTLTENIESHAEYYRNNEDHQAQLESKGEKEATNAKYDTILNELVPFFERHCELSKTEEYALSELMEIHEAAAGQPSDADTPRIAYLESVFLYVAQSRTALNTTGLDGLPELPQPIEESAKNKSVHAEKPSVLKQIRDAQKTPKPPKQKPEREKKTREREL